MGMTQTATATRTIEARIWGVSDHGNGPMVKLYIGGREGIRQFRTRVQLSDYDQVLWFQITLEDDVIVGISI